MSLTTALSIAQSALRNTSRQTSIVSRNVSDASNPDYTRRIAVVTSTAPGARSVDIQRAASELLFKNNLGAMSSLEGQRTLYDGMERLGLAVNGADNASSAATAIGALQQALQIYSASPSNRNLAENAVDAARQVVRTLNSGTQAIQSFRADMDSEIGSAVSELNDLLAQFKDANTDIVSGTRNGRDVSDSLDRRDALLKQISSIVGISTYSRSDNDMVIMTKDGSTLFETIPRTVSFQPQSVYAAGHDRQLRLYRRHTAAGRQRRQHQFFRQDRRPGATARQRRRHHAEPARRGRPRPGHRIRRDRRFRRPAAAARRPLHLGRRSRDSCRRHHRRRAWLARSRSTPPSIPRPAATPICFATAAPTAPAMSTIPVGGASYADLLISYSEKLDQPIAFDAAAAIGTMQSVSSFSTNAISWFEGVRKDASSAAEGKEALATRTAEALSNATGVNVDMEMSLLLDLEHTYEASARLIKAVDDMLSSLLLAVR